ncbi:MAG: hypothetical protein ACK5M3_02355 [Dysgonomonas sp.]
MNDEKYKILIKQIKEKEPVLTDPQKLTADIMSSVQSTGVKKIGTRFLMIISWASSVAAILLLALLITEKSVSAESPVQSEWSVPNYVSLAQIETKADSRNNIRSVIQFKLERQKERESFYSKLASKN